MTASHRTMTTQGELPDIVERLRAKVIDANHFDGKLMKEWDAIRAACLQHRGSDLPRLMFEGQIENFTELLTEAADLIDRLRATPPGSPLIAEREARKRQDAIDELQQAYYDGSDIDYAKLAQAVLDVIIRFPRNSLYRATPSPSPTEREGATPPGSPLERESVEPKEIEDIIADRSAFRATERLLEQFDIQRKSPSPSPTEREGE